jgi:DNA-binding FadR family transcriptional regulator
VTTDNFNPTSLVNRTLESLIKGIVDGTYAAALPPQDELSRKYGVSRTVMREALVILRFCNVLTIRPKVGTTINDRSVWKAAILEGIEVPRNHQLDTALHGLGAPR